MVKEPFHFRLTYNKSVVCLQAEEIFLPPCAETSSDIDPNPFRTTVMLASAATVSTMSDTVENKLTVPKYTTPYRDRFPLRSILRPPDSPCRGHP